MPEHAVGCRWEEGQALLGAPVFPAALALPASAQERVRADPRKNPRPHQWTFRPLAKFQAPVATCDPEAPGRRKQPTSRTRRTAGGRDPRSSAAGRGHGSRRTTGAGTAGYMDEVRPSVLAALSVGTPAESPSGLEQRAHAGTRGAVSSGNPGAAFCSWRRRIISPDRCCGRVAHAEAGGDHRRGGAGGSEAAARTGPNPRPASAQRIQRRVGDQLDPGAPPPAQRGDHTSPNVDGPRHRYKPPDSRYPSLLPCAVFV